MQCSFSLTPYVRTYVVFCKVCIDKFNCTGNIDYNSGPYSVTFPTGTTNALFTIPIADDNITENTEAFLLNINPVSLSNNLIFGDHGGAVVTIVDNDCKFVLIVASVKSVHTFCQLHM